MGITRALSVAIICLVCATRTVFAQHDHAEHSGTNAASMQHAEHAEMRHSDMGHEMTGLYGPYPVSRESSGTAWQPEASPMDGVHLIQGDWMLMLHASAFAVYDYQGGDRGDRKFFSPNMLMGMAQHPLGPGTIGFRSMLSLDPATVGKNGYPLLLQTGETSDGKTPLIDRQHPHDLFMELAMSYSIPIRDDGAVFAYFGYPGEPALGPATFMHRFSGMDNPEAPITHHWLDATHITFGVATLGYIWRDFKLDGSIFTGREPDEHRWNFDEPKFDSYSGRLTWNATKAWSMQVSYGSINSPEELEPEKDIDRVTASASYHYAWGKNNWQTTFAWGRNIQHPGDNLDGYLLESLVNFQDRHTVFARAERVAKDELFPPSDPREGQTFTVNKVSLGYIYDFPKWMHLRFGVGGLGSVHVLPSSLDSTYGDTPLSLMLFVRTKL